MEMAENESNLRAARTKFESGNRVVRLSALKVYMTVFCAAYVILLFTSETKTEDRIQRRLMQSPSSSFSSNTRVSTVITSQNSQMGANVSPAPGICGNLFLWLRENMTFRLGRDDDVNGRKKNRKRQANQGIGNNRNRGQDNGQSSNQVAVTVELEEVPPASNNVEESESRVCMLRAIQFFGKWYIQMGDCWVVVEPELLKHVNFSDEFQKAIFGGTFKDIDIRQPSVATIGIQTDTEDEHPATTPTQPTPPSSNQATRTWFTYVFALVLFPVLNMKIWFQNRATISFSDTLAFIDALTLGDCRNPTCGTVLRAFLVIPIVFLGSYITHLIDELVLGKFGSSSSGNSGGNIATTVTGGGGGGGGGGKTTMMSTGSENITNGRFSTIASSTGLSPFTSSTPGTSFATAYEFDKDFLYFSTIIAAWSFVNIFATLLYTRVLVNVFSFFKKLKIKTLPMYYVSIRSLVVPLSALILCTKAGVINWPIYYTAPILSVIQLIITDLLYCCVCGTNIVFNEVQSPSGYAALLLLVSYTLMVLDYMYKRGSNTCSPVDAMIFAPCILCFLLSYFFDIDNNKAQEDCTDGGVEWDALSPKQKIKCYIGFLRQHDHKLAKQLDERVKKTREETDRQVATTAEGNISQSSSTHDTGLQNCNKTY